MMKLGASYIWARVIGSMIEGGQARFQNKAIALSNDILNCLTQIRLRSLIIDGSQKVNNGFRPSN